MGLFFRKRVYSEKEIQLIEKIEKRIEVLIKEWDQSYKGQEFIMEYRFETYWEGVPKKIGDPPFKKPGDGLMVEESKLYKKIWSDLVKLNQKSQKLIKKGKTQKYIGELIDEIGYFESLIVRLKDEEIKRWDSRLKGFHDYLAGKRGDQLTLPQHPYDRRRLLWLSRWYNNNLGIVGERSAISEAKELAEEAELMKTGRIKLTNRIIAECQELIKDLNSLRH